MLSFFKKERLICLLGAMAMILGGCSLGKKAESTNPKEQSELINVPSSFSLFISETDNCRVLGLTVIEEAPNNLLQEEGRYLFSQETEIGNEVMLSCEEMNGDGNSKYKLLLSLCDSNSEFLCTYTFQNVSLTNNAHIDLSNVLHGEITISVNHEEKTYTGCISAIR